MKKLLIFLTLILMTGCTTKYNLKIKNGEFVEEITNYVYDMDYEHPTSGIEEDNQINDLIENDQYPILDNFNEKYYKVINDVDDYKEIKLKYKYNFEEFSNSNSIASCFEKYELKELDGYYYIKLTGNFYCLYDDSIEINVNTPNKVIYSNARKKSFNNYKWVIDESNYRNVDIEIKISKDNYIKRYVLYGIAGLIILGIIVFITVMINKISNRDKVNEI